MPLREKKPEQQTKEEKPAQQLAGTEEEGKKEESKDQAIPKKEDMSYEVNSEVDQSDDEHKKVDQKKLDKELNQIIYITITETPTNILFYCPSTKYLNLKNGKYKINNIYLIFFIVYIYIYRRSNSTRKIKRKIL